MDKQVFYGWLDTMPYSLGLGDLEQKEDGSMTITIVEVDVLEKAKKERNQARAKRHRRQAKLGSVNYLSHDEWWALDLSDEAITILEKAGEYVSPHPPRPQELWNKVAESKQFLL